MGRLFVLLLLATALFAADRAIPLVSLKIEEVVPHDPAAFTQCLTTAFQDSALLIEGTGLYGHSELRLFHPQRGTILQHLSLPRQYFGEGCTVLRNELYQLTWKERVIFVRDPLTFQEKRKISWKREGWGAASSGDTLWISTGSDTLFALTPEGKELFNLPVQAGGKRVTQLNELADAGPWLLANIWGEECIALIDKKSGGVVEWWDASSLRNAIPLSQREGLDVLNGIAKATSGGWWLTGKYWPYLFRVSPQSGSLKGK